MRKQALALTAALAAIALARPPRTIGPEELTALIDSGHGGERRRYSWRLGEISYRVTGEGTPLVLVHGIQAAASAYEMRRNIDVLALGFKVYAIDLLGFGLSDRPRHRYTADTYVELLTDFLQDVVGGPAHLLASSLSGAFAVRAACLRPDLVRTLTLICPTGIEQLQRRPTVGQWLIGLAFAMPLAGPWLFALLGSRPSIRYFLRAMAYGRRSAVTPELVEAYHRSGQRPGARWAPRAFVGGRLNLDIERDFATLKLPVLLAWGKEATVTPLGAASAFLERNPRAVLKVFHGARLVPHDEQAEAFNTYVRAWLEETEA